MPEINKEWIKKQMGKALTAERSIIETEKDHRQKVKKPEIAAVYDRLIADDCKHLQELKSIGDKYGVTEEVGGFMETAGKLLAGVKGMAEEAVMADPFQSFGHDLMLKSNAVNYDLAWTRIFREIGDEDSATRMEKAAMEDEDHENLMRDTLTSVGLLEASGEELE